MPDSITNQITPEAIDTLISLSASFGQIAGRPVTITDVFKACLTQPVNAEISKQIYTMRAGVEII